MRLSELLSDGSGLRPVVIDFSGHATLIAAVHSVRRIAAILLVAIWLPAVLHCRIENMAGLKCCLNEKNDSGTKSGCENDRCDDLEAGFIKSTSDQVDVAAPQLCSCLICCAAARAPALQLAPSPTGVSEKATAPPEIIQSRHFIARAALPARAPDCVS